MAWSFNPFTGNLDLVGGGGTVVFEGEVETFAELPETIGDPAVGASFLVRSSTGVWLVNRRQAGIWIRRNNTGVRATDWEYGGDYPVNSVNGQTGNVSLTAADVGASATGHTHAASAITSGTLDNARINFAAPAAIGNTTPAAVSATTLAANNGTLTASAPVLDLSQTWNNAAVTFTGLNLALTNTASASASAYLNLALDGTQIFSIRRGESTTPATVITCGGSGLTWTARTRTGAGVGVNFSGVVGVGTTLQFGTGTGTTGGDVVLLRDDAANALAQRNFTNPQTFRLYNTFTDASNHERGFLRWSSNVLQIGTEKAGTGSARALEFQTDGVTRLSITSNGANCDIGSVLRPSTGSTFDLGGNARRWSRLFVNTTILFGDSTSAADPAIKKSGTTLQVRLADDSAYAPLSCSIFNVNGNGAADLVAEFGTAAAGRSHAIQIWGNGTGRNHVITGATTSGVAFSYAAGGQHCAAGTNTTVTGFRQSSVSAYSWSNNSSNAFAGTPDLFLRRDAAGTLSQYDGVNGQAYRLYNTFTSTTSFERLNVRWASNECIIDAEAGSGGGTLRGIKLGSATSSLLGFYGATPVDRPATVADPTGGGTIDAEARTAINDIIDRLQELGLIA